MRMLHLKFLYALAGLIWTGYWSEKLLAAHVAGHIPISTGTFVCLLLFVAVPAIGYGLLFMLLPLAGRFRSR
jgi:hypothetical protein